ncbi:hypothetical protein ACLAE5_004408, partial [Shigella flexneri]
FNEAKTQAEVDRAVSEINSKLSSIQLEYLSLIDELTISKSNEAALKAKHSGQKYMVILPELVLHCLAYTIVPVIN